MVSKYGSIWVFNVFEEAKEKNVCVSYLVFYYLQNISVILNMIRYWFHDMHYKNKQAKPLALSLFDCNAKRRLFSVRY